jgi:hypothetical protein
MHRKKQKLVKNGAFSHKHCSKSFIVVRIIKYIYGSKPPCSTQPMGKIVTEQDHEPVVANSHPENLFY